MSIHETLVPTDDAEVQIEATADTLKPVFAYADKLVDEFKLRVDSDGLRYDVQEKTNVCMVGMDVPANVFEAFDADETVVGVEIGAAMSALRAGRKRHNDAISVSYSDRSITTTVEREYDGAALDLRTRFDTIDPDSIRQPGELGEIDDHLTAEATVDRKALEDVVNATDAVAKDVRIWSDGDDLCFSGNGDTKDAAAVINGVVDGEGADSLFSLDYMADSLKALTTVGVDDVTLQLGDEFPLRVEWEVEWNDATVSGYWIQAPRIQS